MNPNPQINLNTPQKQSKKGLLVLFLYQIQGIIRQAWIPLIYFIYKFKWDNLYYFFGVIGVFVVIFLIVFFKYINFSFYLNETKKEFVIQEGIFNKSKLLIPLEKIQQVNIYQTFLQKLANVYSLDIDTAGSSENEVKIKALDYEVALLFKEKLLNNTFEKINTKIEEEKSIFKLDFTTLIKVALTSQYGKSIAILIGFIFTIYNNINDFSEKFELETSDLEKQSEQIIYNFIGFIILFCLIIVILINLVTTITKYYNLKIEQKNNTLSINSGLFAKKNKLLKPLKVQEISYSQNYFQKKLNFFNLKIKQTSNGSDSKENIENQISIPGCNTNELNQIIPILFEKFPEFSIIATPKNQFFISVFINKILIPLALILIASNFYPFKLSYYFVGLIYLLFVIVINYFRYKNLALSFDGEFLVKKSGVWDITHQIIPSYKIQGITLNQKFWHQKKDVGNIILHTASGKLTFRFAQFSTLEKYVNYWLYQVESSEKKWM